MGLGLGLGLEVVWLGLDRLGLDWLGLEVVMFFRFKVRVRS